MRFREILCLSACALLFAACGKGGNTNSSTTVTNSTNTTRASNTAASPSPAASASPGPAAKVTKPEDAAQGLFNAWKTKDRAAALRFAAAVAVDNLFKEGGPEGLEFQGCERQADDYLCGYSYEGGGLMMTVTGSETEGYKVMSTAFIAD